MTELGLLYVTMGSEGKGQLYYDRGYYWLNNAALEDDARAMYYLGLMFVNGDGVPKDLNRARWWFKKSAAKGNRDAQKILADID
jgi:hypothetical protein